MFVNLSALPSTGVKVGHSVSLSYFPLRWSMCSLARCLWTVEQEMPFPADPAATLSPTRRSTRKPPLPPPPPLRTTRPRPALTLTSAAP